MDKEEKKQKEQVLKLDVAKVIRQKSETLYRFLPKFVINYLRKIVHEDEINEILVRFYDLEGADFATALLKYFNVTYSIYNQERIPSQGSYIIASNHPLGGFDGIILMSLFSNYFPNVKVITNDLLMNVPNLKNAFIPVNKVGKNTTELAKKLNESFEEENVMLFFPAGICSRKIDGQIQDLEWKKTFVNKAKHYKRDIIPLYFEGENSKFFYRLSNIRKKLGIKFNIEMLYLADEFFSQKNKDFRIVIGNVIKYDEIIKESSDLECSKKIRQIVYQLKDDLY